MPPTRFACAASRSPSRSASARSRRPAAPRATTSRSAPSSAGARPASPPMSSPTRPSSPSAPSPWPASRPRTPMPASPMPTGWREAFPDLDLLDATIPSAAELTEMALAVEDAARAVPGVTNSGGASAGWSLGGLVLATSHGFTGSYLTSRFSLSASAIAGTGTGMERDYESEVKVHRGDLSDPATIGRKAGERAVRRLNPRNAADRPRHRGLRPARRDQPRRRHLPAPSTAPSIARKTSFLRDKLGRADLRPRHPDHRRPDPPARPRLASLRRRGRRAGGLRPDRRRRARSAGSSIRRRPASSASSPTATPRAAAAIRRRARPT